MYGRKDEFVGYGLRGKGGRIEYLNPVKFFVCKSSMGSEERYFRWLGKHRDRVKVEK